MNYELWLRFHYGVIIDSASANLEITARKEARVRIAFNPWGNGETAYEGPLDTRSARALHDLVVAALATRDCDDSWNQTGLDGVSIYGLFTTSAGISQKFHAWSPERGTPPHWIVSAAVEAVPLRHDSDLKFGSSLKKLRESLGIGVPRDRLLQRA